MVRSAPSGRRWLAGNSRSNARLPSTVIRAHTGRSVTNSIVSARGGPAGAAGAGTAAGAWTGAAAGATAAADGDGDGPEAAADGGVASDRIGRRVPEQDADREHRQGREHDAHVSRAWGPRPARHDWRGHLLGLLRLPTTGDELGWPPFQQERESPRRLAPALPRAPAEMPSCQTRGPPHSAPLSDPRAAAALCRSR